MKGKRKNTCLTMVKNGSAPLENSGVVAGRLFPRVFREIPKRDLLETLGPRTQVKQPLTRRRFLTGSVLLLVIFIVALLAAVTMGILQMNTEEIQVMRNQIYAAQVMAIAEAGLNDTFAELRKDDDWQGWGGGWDEGLLEDKNFFSPVVGLRSFGGTYTVQVSGDLPNLTVVSVGTLSQGFVAKIGADITVGTSWPYVIRIDELRINDEDDAIN